MLRTGINENGYPRPRKDRPACTGFSFWQAQTTKHLTTRRIRTTVCPMPEVLSCHNMTGSLNFILNVAAKTPMLYAKWLLENVNMNHNVDEVGSLVLLKECKGNGTFKL